MTRFPLILTILFSSLFISCNKDKDAVVPANMLTSDQGLVIELEWNTGGSSNQAVYDSDLDLYLDMGEYSIDASENVHHFEQLYMRDVYKDGIYTISVGAIEVGRRTSYDLLVSAPGGGVIHRYQGYFLAGESGEVNYLRIKKEGRRYTLTDL